jgi:hypothetical protein
MKRSVARANVEHLLELLKHSHLAADRRATIVRLLRAELSQLPRDLDHLNFAERKLKSLRNYLYRAQGAKKVLVGVKEAEELLAAFCKQLTSEPSHTELPATSAKEKDPVKRKT